MGVDVFVRLDKFRHGLVFFFVHVHTCSQSSYIFVVYVALLAACPLDVMMRRVFFG